MNRRLLTIALSAALAAGGMFVTTDSALAGKKKGDADKMEHKYEMGAPVELQALNFLEGSWDINETLTHDGETTEQSATATYRVVLDGSGIEGTYIGKMGENDVEEFTLLTFNRKTQSFEMVAANNLWPMLHVFGEGTFEDGKLTLLAHKTKGDKEVHMRRTVERVSDDSFTAVNEFDKGEGWTVWATETYTRR